MKYSVSVIIPVYNKEKYLKQCLDSVVNQTLESIEIIIVNDGSTDGSSKIIEEYRKKYDNIKVINQENKGVVEARIVGYLNSTGDYIGWVDADDFVDLGMFEKLYNNAKKNDSDVSICSYKFYPYKPSKKSVWFEEYEGTIDYRFLKKSSLQVNKIVKRELLQKVDIVKLFKTAGEGSYSIVILNAKKIVTIPEELYNYRIGDKTLSTTYKNLSWYEKNIEKSKNRLKAIENTKFEEQWKEYFEYTVYYSLLLALIVAINNDNLRVYKKYKKEIKKKIYRENKYKREILLEEQGKIKTFILINVIENSYILSWPIVKIFLKMK